MDFAENIVSNPVTIKLRREEESLDNIKQVSNIVNQMLLHGASISSLFHPFPYHRNWFVFICNTGVGGLPHSRGKIPVHSKHIWSHHYRTGVNVYGVMMKHLILTSGDDLLPHPQDGELAGGEDDSWGSCSCSPLWGAHCGGAPYCSWQVAWIRNSALSLIVSL